MLGYIRKLLEITKSIATSTMIAAKDKMLDLLVAAPPARIKDKEIRSPELLSIFEFTITSNHLKSEDYNHGDPRNYLSCMQNALRKGSKTESSFNNDLMRISVQNVEDGVVCDVDRNLETRLLLVEKKLEQIAKSVATTSKKWITKDGLRSIMSHLSHGLMAEVLFVFRKHFDFTFLYKDKLKKANHSISSYERQGSSTLTFDGNIVRYETRMVAFPFASHGQEEVERFTKNEVHLNITTITTIDFSKLSVHEAKFQKCNEGMIQTITISSDSQDLKFGVSALVKGFQSISDYILVDGADDEQIFEPFSLDLCYIPDYCDRFTSFDNLMCGAPLLEQYKLSAKTSQTRQQLESSFSYWPYIPKRKTLFY